MIFSQGAKKASCKKVSATADFSTLQNATGKIVADTFSHLTLGKYLGNATSFKKRQDTTVLQYLPKIGNGQWYLGENGVVGDVVLEAFANCQKVAFALHKATNTLAISHGQVGTYLVANGVATKVCDISFASLAFCHDRLWGLKEGNLYFSNAVDFATLLDNYIQLPAKSVALSVAQNLFVVGEDICKVFPDGEEGYIKIVTVATNVNVTLPDTVATWDNKVYFVANGRLNCYYGNVKEVYSLPFDVTKGVIFQGNYFACGSGIVSISLSDKKMVAMYNVNCQDIFAGEELLVVINKKGYECSSKATPSYWKSQRVDFGSGATKYLSRLNIQTEWDIDLHVLADSHRIYHLKGSNNAQSIAIGGYGKNIRIELFADGKVNVSFLQLTARVYEEVGL